MVEVAMHVGRTMRACEAKGMAGGVFYEQPTLFRARLREAMAHARENYPRAFACGTARTRVLYSPSWSARRAGVSGGEAAGTEEATQVVSGAAEAGTGAAEGRQQEPSGASEGAGGAQAGGGCEHVLLLLEQWAPAVPSAALYSAGVHVHTCKHPVRSIPCAKAVSWIAARGRLREQHALVCDDPLCAELLLTEMPGGGEVAAEEYGEAAADEALVLEGTGTNIFGVRRGEGEAAPVEVVAAVEKSLPGIAQRIALAALTPLEERGRVIVKRRLMSVREAKHAMSEVVLCSASRGIFPVVAVDGVAIGDGGPGPFFSEWFKAYHRYVEEHAVEI
eukprot:TRINITY_DN2600_c0_g1_i1.p1 TRINITY_DN2600_c0_g1~~TRINITY_DN2600_c0_g1_i1.p1  ORF type:complete len:391 (+),score=112.20 TRINITY_DN2600_c0_g1_i1:173-1174(+)